MTGKASLGLAAALLHHLAHGGSGARGALFAPGLEPRAGLFNRGEKVRVLERGTPRRNDGAHAVPDDPKFPIAFKKEFVVDQSAIDDAGDHIPITNDHADIGVLLAALR